MKFKITVKERIQSEDVSANKIFEQEKDELDDVHVVQKIVDILFIKIKDKKKKIRQVTTYHHHLNLMYKILIKQILMMDLNR